MDPRKAYNICEYNSIMIIILDLVNFFTLSAAILLGHLKMPFAKIKEAVLSCDESVLSEQHLRQMETFAPDDKEVQISIYI